MLPAMKNRRRSKPASFREHWPASTRSAACTGTGKTASFVIPILETIDPHHVHAHPQMLVLVPTRTRRASER